MNVFTAPYDKKVTAPLNAQPVQMPVPVYNSPIPNEWLSRGNKQGFYGNNMFMNQALSSGVLQNNARSPYINSIVKQIGEES